MKAFLSYSFRDSELFVVTLLLEKLRQNGFSVESSNRLDLFYYTNNKYKILGSDFFIGIVTNNSESINAVVREWQIANEHNIKSILVIEEGVVVEESKSFQVIRFNRLHPEAAIDKLLASTKTPRRVDKSEDTVSATAIIVVLAALIGLLASTGKGSK